MCFCSWLQLPYGHFRKQTRKAVRGGSELRNKASTTRVDLALHKLSKQLKMVRRSKWRPADAATQKMAYTHARRVLSTNLGLFVDLFVHCFASFFSFFLMLFVDLCAPFRFFIFFIFFKVVLLPRRADGQSSGQSVVVSPCTGAWPISQGGAAVAAWPKTLCPQPWVVVMMSVRTSPPRCTCTAFSCFGLGDAEDCPRTPDFAPTVLDTAFCRAEGTVKTVPYWTLPSIGLRGQ